VLGGNNVAIFGSGFSQSTPSLSWSGNDGVSFLNGDSWVQVYSDVEIWVYADLFATQHAGNACAHCGYSGLPDAGSADPRPATDVLLPRV
jgi:hypothetical protein